MGGVWGSGSVVESKLKLEDHGEFGSPFVLFICQINTNQHSSTFGNYLTDGIYKKNLLHIHDSSWALSYISDKIYMHLLLSLLLALALWVREVTYSHFYPPLTDFNLP